MPESHSSRADESRSARRDKWRSSCSAGTSPKKCSLSFQLIFLPTISPSRCHCLRVESTPGPQDDEGSVLPLFCRLELTTWPNPIW